MYNTFVCFKVCGYLLGGKHCNKLTLRACMATWGTLWLILFIIDLKLSFGLQHKRTEFNTHVICII